MSGWTAICLFLLGLQCNQPFVAVIAAICGICGDSPRQRFEALQARVKRLEGKGDA